jgi:hypothetical protein
MSKDYTIEEHIHRYGKWTAARAASSGRFSNLEISACIDQVRLRQRLERLKKQEISHKQYENWFIQIVSELQACLQSIANTTTRKRNASFGIAAKVVSIYLKTAEILPSKGLSNVSEVAYPPIDSVLLIKLNRKFKLELKSTAWSKFDKEDYTEVLQKLRKINLEIGGWQLEEWWDISKTDS